MRPGVKLQPEEDLKRLNIEPLDPMAGVVRQKVANFPEGVPQTPYERLQSYRGKDKVAWAFGNAPKPPPPVDPRKYMPAGHRKGKRGRIKPEAQKLYERHKLEAKLAIQGERYEDGIRHADAALKAVPGKWSLMFLRAVCHASMGLWAMTLQDAENCIAMCHTSYEGSFYRAYALFRMKR